MLLTFHCSFADWSVGGAALGSPSPRPSPPGRGRTVHRLSITPETALAQRLWAKHQTDACCSLSLPPSRRSGALARREGGRERVRVRGKHSIENAKGSIIQRLLGMHRKKSAAALMLAVVLLVPWIAFGSDPAPPTNVASPEALGKAA